MDNRSRGSRITPLDPPYEPEVAGFHSKGWELELERLEAHLAQRQAEEADR